MGAVYTRYPLSAPRLPIVSYLDGTLLTAPDTLRPLGVDHLWIPGPDTMFSRLRTTTENFTTRLCDPKSLMVRPRVKSRTA